MEMELKKLRDPGACRLKNLDVQIYSNQFNTFEDELNTLFLLPFCVYSKQREGNSVKEPER